MANSEVLDRMKLLVRSRRSMLMRQAILLWIGRLTRVLRFWQSRVLPADGRVFGKMGHSERSGNGLYKNVPGTLYQPIFEGGVNYFA